LERFYLHTQAQSLSQSIQIPDKSELGATQDVL